MTDSEYSLLRDAFEDAPFEFWVRDLEGRCVVANAETRRLGGRVGQKVEDTPVPPEVIASWQSNNRRALAGEVVQNEFEYGAKPPDLGALERLLAELPKLRTE